MIFCDLFQPVITDQGICYSFNGISSLNFLRNSSFKQSFSEVYQSELTSANASSIIKSTGAGSQYALNVYVSNSKFWRKSAKTKLYKVGISSAYDYFDFKSTSNSVKPGYINVFEVTPIEVVATDSLKDIPMKQRKCKLHHESDESELFQMYSQSSCEFECRVKMAFDQCLCIPWDVPRLDLDTHTPVCDLNGNYCFNDWLGKEELVESCNCPQDCASVRYSYIKQEFPIEIEKVCNHTESTEFKLAQLKLESGYAGLIQRFYEYDEQPMQESLGGVELAKKICREIMSTDIGIISIRLGTKKYIKTIMDKRVTFTDQLGDLGMYLMVDLCMLTLLQILGGTLGLFTGMSLLSIVELGFWVVKLACKKLVSKPQKKT